MSAAQTNAARYGHQQVDVEHLLAALLDQESGLAISRFTKAGIQGRDGMDIGFRRYNGSLMPIRRPDRTRTNIFEAGDEEHDG